MKILQVSLTVVGGKLSESVYTTHHYFFAVEQKVNYLLGMDVQEWGKKPQQSLRYIKQISRVKLPDTNESYQVLPSDLDLGMKTGTSN